MEKSDILEALARVETPGGGNMIADDLVHALQIEGASVRFVMEIAPDQARAMEPVRQEAEAALRALGAAQVLIAMTAARPAAPPDLSAARAAKPVPQPERLPGVRRIIAVGSGKGGVGKSTVSANLAAALAAEGAKVGLLDADIYGPSQHRMFGITKRPASPDGQKIVPVEAHGVRVLSLGMMLRGDEAVIWRGPKLIGALQQMLFQTVWGELDYLIVDLPPGTGDVQLTLAQRVVLDGALLVTTPQEIALIDARKAADMFGKTQTPLIGVIENMARYCCPECGHEADIFGAGGGAAEAERLGAPLLASLPLEPVARVAADAGQPVVLAAPESASAAAFSRLAEALRVALKES